MKRPPWLSRAAWFAMSRRSRKVLSRPPRPLTLRPLDEMLRSIAAPTAIGPLMSSQLKKRAAQTLAWWAKP